MPKCPGGLIIIMWIPTHELGESLPVIEDAVGAVDVIGIGKLVKGTGFLKS